MRALVTGLNGFTGRYVGRELEQAGWEVHGLGSTAPAGLLRSHQADLDDVDHLGRAIAAIQPQLVIHLAAIAFVAHGAPEQLYRTNLIGTRNLLEALSRHARPDAVILASSANVYGNSTGGILAETNRLEPANDYAVSKAAMELMAATWRDRLPLIITRPFNYTGVGQAENFLLPKIVAHFRRRAPIIELGNLQVWRDFCDVRDVAEAYRALAEASPIGEVFNIASGRTYSLAELISCAEKISGHQLEVRVNPAFVRANEVRSLCGDTTRLRAAIGSWQPRPIEATLRWMLDA